MSAKYELKNDKILKNGHTMFLEDVLSDLQRKSYLETERLKQLDENKENVIKEENTKTPIDLINTEIKRIIDEKYSKHNIIFFISELYDEDCYILTLIINNKWNCVDYRQSIKIDLKTDLENAVTLLYNRTTK